MARDHGRVRFSMWDDAELMQCSRSAILLYVSLFSQPTMTWSGVLPLMVSRWAEFGGDCTADQVETDLKALEVAGFVAVDRRTHEVLVRSLIRNDGIAKQPNVLQAALKEASAVRSPYLRHVLASELRRIAMPESSRKNPKYLDPVAVAEEIDPGPQTPPPEPFANPSQTLPEPSENPLNGQNGNTQVNGAEIAPSSTPSRTLREPPGEGEGVTYPQRGPVGNGVACSRANGRTRAREAGITHDELAATAHSQSAHQLVHAWNDRHGAGYRTQTLRSLTKQVDQLRADRGRDDVIADALDLWHQRTGASPGLLPHLYDDALKTRNGATNGRPSRGDKVRGWLELDENAPIDQQPRGARGDKARAWLDLEVDDEDEDDTRDFAEIVASFGKPRSLPGGAA